MMVLAECGSAVQRRLIRDLCLDLTSKVIWSNRLYSKHCARCTAPWMCYLRTADFPFKFKLSRAFQPKEYILYIWISWLTSMIISSIIFPRHTYLIYCSFIAAGLSYRWNIKQVNFPMNVSTFSTYHFCRFFFFLM